MTMLHQIENFNRDRNYLFLKNQMEILELINITNDPKIHQRSSTVDLNQQKKSHKLSRLIEFIQFEKQRKKNKEQ